ESAQIVAPHATTDSATRCTSLGMRRRNTCTDERPRASEKAARASTASVVTLMPPAVDAEPPPTNMSIEPTTSDEPCRSSIGITENPPERVIADRKNVWKVVSQASSPPKVRGLSYSSRRNTSAPATKSTTVVIRVSLACSDHCRKCQWCLNSVKITGNPM